MSRPSRSIWAAAIPPAYGDCWRPLPQERDCSTWHAITNCTCRDEAHRLLPIGPFSTRKRNLRRCNPTNTTISTTSHRQGRSMQKTPRNSHSSWSVSVEGEVKKASKSHGRNPENSPARGTHLPPTAASKACVHVVPGWFASAISSISLSPRQKAQFVASKLISITGRCRKQK